MPIINVGLADLDKALRGHVQARREDALKAVRDAVKQHGPRLAVEVVAGISPPPVDRGTYRQGFKAVDTPKGAALVNHVPHAGVIEEGRRPGARMPPLAAIEAWVRRKLRVAIKQGRRPKMSDNDYKRAAYLVARSIARRGLPAHHVMAKIDAKLRPLVWEAVRKAVGGGP